MNEDLRLRQAYPEDAEFTASIIYDTMGFGSVLLGTDSKKECLRRIQMIFKIPGHRLSYDGCRILCQGEQDLGYIMAYPHQEVKRRDRKYTNILLRLNGWWGFIRMNIKYRKLRLFRESHPNEYYLSALGIAAYQRGKGHAARMLQMILDEAWKGDYAWCSLTVDNENHEARSLYRKTGFRVDSTTNSAGHLISRMIIANPTKGNPYANRRF